MNFKIECIALVSYKTSPVKLDILKTLVSKKTAFKSNSGDESRTERDIIRDPEIIIIEILNSIQPNPRQDV